MTGVVVPAAFGQSVTLTALSGKVQLVVADHGEVESVVLVDGQTLQDAITSALIRPNVVGLLESRSGHVDEDDHQWIRVDIAADLLVDEFHLTAVTR